MSDKTTFISILSYLLYLAVRLAPIKTRLTKIKYLITSLFQQAAKMMGKSLPDPISGVMNNGTKACKKIEVLENIVKL